MKKFLLFLLCSFSFHAFTQTLEEALTFRVIPNATLEEMEFETFKTQFESGWYQNVDINVKLVSEMEGGAAAILRPVLDELKEPHLQLVISPEVLKNPDLRKEIFSYKKAFDAWVWGNQAAWMETVVNARLGSKVALLSLYNARLGVIKDPQLASILDTRTSELENNVKKLETEVKKLTRESKNQFEVRKVIFNELDKADGQLKDLIAANDRQGVAKLLNHYVPWEFLEPVEKKFWENWIDVIKNPLPLEQRTLLIRGLEEGQFFSNSEGKAFLMSPLLIHNQGTYNRRLRSMTTMLDKSVSMMSANFETETNNFDLKQISSSNRLSNQFARHAIVPTGSPYISLTKRYETASSFSLGKIATYAIDPRILTPNYMSHFIQEAEVLANMFVFPDELVALTNKTDEKEVWKNTVLEFLQQKLGREKAEEMFRVELENYDLENFKKNALSDYFRFLDKATDNNCRVYFLP